MDSVSLKTLKDYIKLSNKHMRVLESVQSIKRFYNLENIIGIGKTTYEKLF